MEGCSTFWRPSAALNHSNTVCVVVLHTDIKTVAAFTLVSQPTCMFSSSQEGMKEAELSSETCRRSGVAIFMAFLGGAGG